ncbi:hypothetical protein M422DRAFT_46178 [Sphaerobolus stellatus SS14]|nr:hypothetical protein M422DRAFT_46178 [Sphaerobolus stellatus SS14]
MAFRSFGFLTKHHFIIPVYDLEQSAKTPSLKVYDFSQPVNTQLEPALYRTFQLPLLSPDFDISDMIIRCCPLSEENISKLMPPGYPFYTPPSSWIVSISLQITGDLGRYGLMLFFFPSTILSDEYSCQESVKWESWGPKGTRILPMDWLEEAWIKYTYGTRFATIERREERIYVYDRAT